MGEKQEKRKIDVPVRIVKLAVSTVLALESL